jgi:hypothetical protein
LSIQNLIYNIYGYLRGDRVDYSKKKNIGIQMNLLIHVGAGKTGTTSIQNCLKNNGPSLIEKGFLYVGLNFEGLSENLYPWQTPGGFHSLVKQPTESITQQLTKTIMFAIKEAESLNCHTVIWSNESLLSAKKIINILSAKTELSNVHIKAIGYVRRHDKWAKSAYEQWGLKHKTYHHKIKAFSQWSETFKFDFFANFSEWEKLSDEFILRNMDAVNDVAIDFLEQAGIDQENLKVPKRSNVKLLPEELQLRMLFNNEFKRPVFKREFDQYLPASVHRKKHLLNDFLPTQKELQTLITSTEGDRKNLNSLLPKEHQFSEQIIATGSELSATDNESTLSFILGVNAKLASKVHLLSEELNELKGIVDNLKKDS